MTPYEFRTELWKSVFLIRTYMGKIIDPIAQREGLTALQTFVLVCVSQGHAKNVGSLCSAAGLTQGNASSICKRLEKMGFLERHRSLKDERVVELTISDKGQNTLDLLREQFEKLDSVLEQESEQKLETILKGFHEAAEIVQKFSKSYEDTCKN